MNQPLGVKALRAFLRVMASNKLQPGAFGTSSTVITDAHFFAKANGINA